MSACKLVAQKLLLLLIQKITIIGTSHYLLQNLCQKFCSLLKNQKI